MLKRFKENVFRSKSFNCRFIFSATNLKSESQNSWLDDLAQSSESILPTYELHKDGDGPEPGVLTSSGGLKFKNLGTNIFNYSRRRFSLKDYFMGNEHNSLSVVKGYDKKKGREQRTFADLKLIRVSTGKGGNGAVTFFRDAFRPVGPPDGGDGGDGGSVYLQAVDKMASLHRLKRSYQAKNGTPGMGQQLDGKNGDDLIIEIPVGTTIRWIPDPLDLKQYSTGNKEDFNDLEVELSCVNNDIQFIRKGYKPGYGWIFKEKDEEYYRERNYFNDLNAQVKVYDEEIISEERNWDRFPLLGMDFDKPTKKPFLLLKGGKGGMGNMHFLTKDIRNPRFSKKGREGIVEFFLLELRLIADLGLVGLPNAGKSTLLRAISRARPRVGHWEFTTLQPTIGTIFTNLDRDPFTVADIPGIIKGASQNKGMGLDFLRHVERSGGLVFVVSLSAENPVADLETLISEVGEKRMVGKRVLVVATKADQAPTIDIYTKLKEFAVKRQWSTIPVSALKGHNIEHCIWMMSATAAKV